MEINIRNIYNKNNICCICKYNTYISFNVPIRYINKNNKNNNIRNIRK